MFTAPPGVQSTQEAQRSTARPLSRERVYCCPFMNARAFRVPSAYLAALLVLLASVLPASAMQATPTSGDALSRSTDWLLAQEAPDGGFLGFSGESDAGATIDAIFALVAANQSGVDADYQPALEYLNTGDVALVYAQTGAGQAAKLALVAVATGGDPRNVNGVDPLSLAVAGINDQSGLYGTGVFDHALVMLAIAAAGDEVPSSAIRNLYNAQIDDGSWAFDATTTLGAGDTNTTAIAIMALVAAGKGVSGAVNNALRYLQSTQLDGGGFPFQPGDGAVADANSTAVVIQSLIAAGADSHADELENAQAALLSFQNESGAFRYMDDPQDDNLIATVQAIPAIAGRALPMYAEGAVPIASPEAALLAA